MNRRRNQNGQSRVNYKYRLRPNIVFMKKAQHGTQNVNTSTIIGQHKKLSRWATRTPPKIRGWIQVPAKGKQFQNIDKEMIHDCPLSHSISWFLIIQTSFTSTRDMMKLSQKDVVCTKLDICILLLSLSQYLYWWTVDYYYHWVNTSTGGPWIISPRMYHTPRSKDFSNDLVYMKNTTVFTVEITNIM